MDGWRKKELDVAGLAMALAIALTELIDSAEDEEEVDYHINLRETCLNAADVFSPPGEPESGFKDNVVSLDRHRGLKQV